DARDDAAGELRLEATACHLDFRKFRHFCAAPTLYLSRNIPKMGRSPMSYFPSLLSRVALFAAVSLAACGTLSQPAPQGSSLELDETNLYDLLLGEIALQRGDAGLAAQTYADAAKRTRDPRVAR